MKSVRVQSCRSDRLLSGWRDKMPWLVAATAIVNEVMEELNTSTGSMIVETDSFSELDGRNQTHMCWTIYVTLFPQPRTLLCNDSMLQVASSKLHTTQHAVCNHATMPSSAQDLQPAYTHRALLGAIASLRHRYQRA